MKICCAQLASVFGDPIASLAKADDAVRSAAASGADLVIFPEQFPTGWDPSSIASAEGDDGVIASGWCRIAEEHGAWIVGSHRFLQKEGVQNIALLISPAGAIAARYAKVHLFSPGGEDQLYIPGDVLVLSTCAGLRIGLAICYDLRFPGLFWRYADAGAECMVVTAAWPCSRRRHFDLFIRARAIENQFFVAGVCTTGKTPVDSYCGGSLLVDPVGEVLCSAGEEETLISAEIDRGRLHRVRSDFPVRLDARRDLWDH